jgi:hypothetical protein
MDSYMTKWLSWCLLAALAAFPAMGCGDSKTTTPGAGGGFQSATPTNQMPQSAKDRMPSNMKPPS